MDPDSFGNGFPHPPWMHGDVLIQLCANNADSLHRAVRDIAGHTRHAMQVRWKSRVITRPPTAGVDAERVGLQGRNG